MNGRNSVWDMDSGRTRRLILVRRACDLRSRVQRVSNSTPQEPNLAALQCSALLNDSIAFALVATPLAQVRSCSVSSRKFGGKMQKWAWILAVPVLISFAGAQISPSLNLQGARSQDPSSQGTWHAADSDERMFFPRDMFWGWAQFDLSPPHNEIDPNLCAGNAGQYGAADAPCSMFARYMLSGTLEVRPFGRGPLRRFMVFGAPTFLFGKNVPQRSEEHTS